MDVNLINSYLQQSNEIIGQRSLGEIKYDDAVVAHLAKGTGIKKAIAAANKQHPEEALKAGPGDWDDLAARYGYLLEHKGMLKELGIRE
jgi:hypothetical protein